MLRSVDDLLRLQKPLQVNLPSSMVSSKYLEPVLCGVAVNPPVSVAVLVLPVLNSHAKNQPLGSVATEYRERIVSAMPKMSKATGHAVRE